MKLTKYIVQALFFILFIFAIASGKMMLWLGLFVLSLIGSFIFGRFYCGYICPMNTTMGVVEKLSQKLKWQTKRVPKFLQSKALPWLVLVLMIVTMVLSKKVLHKDLPILLILLILSALLTLRYEQWVFHNHVCPYGALLSLTGKHPKYTTVVNQDQCVGCKLCESVCPSQAIKVDKDSKKAQINTSLCHQCQACSNVCPQGAIHYDRN